MPDTGPLILTPDQMRARDLMGSRSRHILLRGGARSGKTVILIDGILRRALAAKQSRHLVARFRANSLNTIIGPTGTLKFVMQRQFPPELDRLSKFKAQDNLLLLPNGSEIWFGGLDDPKRVDKILGFEFATIFLNEASQIPYGSFTTVLTRLAQVAKISDDVVKNIGQGTLKQKLYVDCNPPPETHWLNTLFEKKRDPDTKRPVVDPGDYTSMVLNPEGNSVNLDQDFLESLRRLPERQRKRFYLGLYGDAGEAALWTSELLDQQRMLDSTKMPGFVRKVVAIDPSGARDPEDAHRDEIGIVVVGLGTDGRCYLLEDLTMKGSPETWAKVATDAYSRHEANGIVVETNFGGDMVRAVVQAAKPGVPIFAVTASRGKHVRAEPVSALYQQDKVRHVGYFQNLEDELVGFTTAGYTGERSPNRADALVWAVTELFPRVISHAKSEETKGLHNSRMPEPKVNRAHQRWKRGR